MGDEAPRRQHIAAAAGGKPKTCRAAGGGACAESGVWLSPLAPVLGGEGPGVRGSCKPPHPRVRGRGGPEGHSLRYLFAHPPAVGWGGADEKTREEAVCLLSLLRRTGTPPSRRHPRTAGRRGRAGGSSRVPPVEDDLAGLPGQHQVEPLLKLRV